MLLFYRNSPCVVIGRNQVCVQDHHGDEPNRSFLNDTPSLTRIPGRRSTFLRYVALGFHSFEGIVAEALFIM